MKHYMWISDLSSPKLAGYVPVVSVSVRGQSSHLYHRPYHPFLQNENFSRSFWPLYRLLYHLSIAAQGSSTPSLFKLLSRQVSQYSLCLQSGQGKGKVHSLHHFNLTSASVFHKHFYGN